MIISSFLSDSAISMGGSDFGGSFQQPLMDRKVISIGVSSSEDTCCGASENESTYSKRLKALRCTGGGTSHFRRRARPSATSPIRDPVSVMVILPLFFF